MEEENYSADRFDRIDESNSHNEDIAWDKGEPNYRVTVDGKVFYVRNLKIWCEFYQVNYQMLLRKLREGSNLYRGVYVERLA